MASSGTCNNRLLVSRAYEDVYFPEKSLAIPFKWEACPGTPINNATSHVLLQGSDDGYAYDDGDTDDDDDHDMEDDDVAVGAPATPGIYPLPPPPRLSSFSSSCLSPLCPAVKTGGFDETGIETARGFLDADEEEEEEEDAAPVPPLPLPPAVKFHSFRADVIPLPLGVLHTTLQERSRSFNHALTTTANTPHKAHQFTLSPALATWCPLTSSHHHHPTKLKLKDFLLAKDPFLNTGLELVPTTCNTRKSALQLFVVRKRSLYNNAHDSSQGPEVANLEYPSSPSKTVEPPHHDEYGLVLASNTEAFYCKELSIERKPIPKVTSRSFSRKLKIFLFNECTMCWRPKHPRSIPKR